MDMSNTLASIGESVLEARKRAGVEEVTAADGMIYCKKCGETLMLPLHFTGELAEKLGDTRWVPRNCNCMRAMFAVEDAEEEKKRRAEEIRGKKYTGLKSEKYRQSTFDLDDGRNPKIRRMCERYVEKRGDMIDGNYGLAFLGSNGRRR